MAANTDSTLAPVLPPPRFETGMAGWARANLFSTWYNTALTIFCALVLALTLWFGLGWVLLKADWSVIATVGGRFVIGNYNSDQNCPGNDCFWRPQVSLLMVTLLLGMAWGLVGAGVVRRLAIGTAVVAALFALLPYDMERMGMDVRLLLAANLLTLVVGWALARYTPIGTPRWIAILGVVAFLLTILLLLGMPEVIELPGWLGLLGLPEVIELPRVSGLQTVDVRQWGGLTLNLILAVSGIVLSLPIGIALALGRRSEFPVLKVVCVVFIECFRGVPLITLLFMSQHIVPLAFPEAFPRNSLLNAAIVITLFSSAYMAENIRGGLQSLHPGQAEAARALGLPGWQTMLFISLPQAIRNVIPAIVGQFIGLFKDTSLVYIIGMLDMVEIGRTTVVGKPEYQGSVQEMFVFIALVFWVFTYTMSYVSRRFERHLGVGER